jgi:protein-disulfide isomerase
MKLILGLVVGVGLLVGGLWYLSGMDAPDAKQLDLVESDWKQGPENPKLTLVEYADFECPACAAYQPVLKDIKETFKNDLRFVYRQFPLPMHRNGMAASLASEAAGLQGKFWEMHDLLYAKQKEWGGKTAEDRAVFEQYASTLGLDIEKFKQDMSSDAVKGAVERGLESGEALNVRGTPTFFLNGEKLDTPGSAEAFKELLRSKLGQ